MFSIMFQLVSAFWQNTSAEPAPGRVPKVYNALITSNQNLEPSKAYPVYQPVLHDAFAFSYQQPIFYGGDLLGNGLVPASSFTTTKETRPSEGSQVSTLATATEVSPSSTVAPTTTEEPTKQSNEGSASTPSPTPPNTQSPIPLNEFGLPPQVLPLGHIDPLYNALPQFNPFTYRYPGVRFYDPYDPFGFNSYTSFPVYRPLPNVLGHSLPILTKLNNEPNKSPVSEQQNSQTPPPEPSDLNILNYASQDPTIPNVPPPPLPQGGLKNDKSE
ncbi:hypothetical protein HW555_002685 [Spodoptera exigua]|uniref:Uncharacterized protein n=1 Tax=Spodoptera exigua TaxID=7107 RepID=A0A835GLV8_SPOEX|nr:hypothetical protein HW555_002685 [Spodoptera exigua]